MNLIIVGASHQASVVLWLARRQSPKVDVVAVLDASPGGSFVGRMIDGHEVVGTVDNLRDESYLEKGVQVVPAVGNPDLRRLAVETALAFHLEVGILQDPTSLVADTASVAPGTVVAPGAVLGPHSVVGAGCIINTGAIVEHHATIGDYVHVGPGAVLAGSVEVRARTVIGAGANVRNDVRVGSDVTVGIGAAVVSDIADGLTVVGVPATSLEE